MEDKKRNVKEEYNILKDKLYSTLGKEAKAYNNLTDEDMNKLTEKEFIYLSNKKLLDQITGENESISMIEVIEEKLGKAIRKGISQDLRNIPNLIRPTEYVSNIDKVYNILWSGKIDFNIEQELGMESRFDKERKEKVSTYINLIISGVRDKLPPNINSQDMRVYRAITSLTLMRNRYITLNDLHRTIEDNPKAKLRDKRRKEINDSITKLATTRLYIKCKREKNSYYPNLKEIYDGQIINVNRKTVIRGGHEQVGLILGDISILFEYAEDKNQIMRTKVEVANIPISASNRNDDLKDYLLQRVSRIRHKYLMLEKSNDKKKSQGKKIIKKNLPQRGRTITYKSIYENLDIASQTNSNQTLKVWEQRTRETTNRVLSHFIDTGYIKGYYDPVYENMKVWNKKLEKYVIETKEHDRKDIKDKCILMF